MQADLALEALAGSARWKELAGHVSWRELQSAVAAGTVRRVGAAYHLPDCQSSQRLAVALRATRSHLSAARHWRMAQPPDESGLTHLTIPYKARRTRVPDGVQLHYRNLAPADVDAGVTSPLITVVDCLRDCSLRVALSAGDSALRTGLVDRRELAAAVGGLRGPNSARAAQRLDQLDAQAANAFESTARSILLAAGIESFRTQVGITHRRRFIGRVDLADETLHIVIECDGFETHGTLEAMTRDATRHTWLTSAGWRTLRFTWHQVMFRPAWVLERVLETIDVARREGFAVQRPVRRSRPAA